MRILFLMTDLQLAKYYYQTLHFLLQRGHRVHLAFFNSEGPEKDKLHHLLAANFSDRFSWGEAPRKRSDVWHALCVACAWGIDYLFYFQPALRNAHRLRERLEARIHPVFVWLVNKCPLARTLRGLAFVKWLLRAVYDSIPVDASIKRFIQKFEADILLVTPLVFQGSLQSEYLRAARALGIPSAHCVASWDNLTTKGLIRGNPDRVMLWNDIQKQEAVTLHGFPPEKIVVTGAQYFDDWFVRTRSRTREEFCRVLGFRPDRPILLYMCSSNFMAPNEGEFVLRWVTAIRNSHIPRIAEAGILIRPYPKSVEQWRAVDLARYGNVVVWPRDGEYASTDTGRMNFCDSVYHSLAVTGINTTAMIESAIIGRCVLTVLAPELNESQSNTIHFNYMRRENGGFLYLAHNLDEHLTQLQEILDRGDMMTEQVRQFVLHFVRPHGMKNPCVPILSRSIEELIHVDPEKSRFSSKQVAARFLLYPVALLFRVARLLTYPGRKAEQVRRKKLLHKAREGGHDPLEYVRGRKRRRIDAEPMESERTRRDENPGQESL